MPRRLASALLTLTLPLAPPFSLPGINFQKASCTLDGCVKIWTSRVDSVATETGKLLSGLTETGNGEDGDENGEGGSDGDDGEDEAGKKKRKVRALASPHVSLSADLDLRCSSPAPPDRAQHQHARAVIRVALDQEARPRVLGRPALQEDERRL